MGVIFVTLRAMFVLLSVILLASVASASLECEDHADCKSCASLAWCQWCSMGSAPSPGICVQNNGTCANTYHGFAYDDPVGCICDAPESQRDCRNCTATVFCQFNTCCGGYCSPADKDAYCGSTQCSSPIKLSPDCPANAPATKRLRATPNSGPAPAQHVRK